MAKLRTQEEIVARYREMSEGYKDFFGAHRGDLLKIMTPENGQQFYKDFNPASTFEHLELNQENVVAKIKNYMPFAFEKANDNRGLSAERSIEHMLCWTWLLNDGFHERLEKSFDEEYQYYGKPQLVFVCQRYGIDWRALDDSRWTNDSKSAGISADLALTQMGLNWYVDPAAEEKSAA